MGEFLISIFYCTTVCASYPPSLSCKELISWLSASSMVDFCCCSETTWSLRKRICDLSVSSVCSWPTLAAIISSRYFSSSSCMSCNSSQENKHSNVLYFHSSQENKHSNVRYFHSSQENKHSNVLYFHSSQENKHSNVL